MVVPHHPHHIQKNHRWYHSWQSHDNWSARRPKHHGTTTTCGMVGHNNRIVVVVVAVIVRVLFIVSILLLLMVLVVVSQQLLFMTTSTTTTTTTTTSFDSVLQLLIPIRLTPTITTATISQQQSRVDRSHVNNHEEEDDDNHESRLEFYHSLMEYLRQQQQPVPSQSSSKHYSSNNSNISKTKWMTHFIQHQQQQQQRSNSSTSKSSRNSKYSDANDPITPLWKNDDHDTTISFTSNSMVDLLPYCNMTAILIHNTAHHSHIRSTNTTIRTTTQQWLDRHSPFIVPSNRINVTQYVHTLLQQIQHPLLPHVVSPQRLQQLRTAIQYEIWLQLLEQYMSMKYSMYCNYTDYFHDISHRLQPQPSLPTTSTATNTLAFHPSETTTHHTHSDANTLDIAIRENQSLTSSSSSRHIVYIISAYKDIVHLQSLLEAIGMYRPTERDNNHSQHFRTTIIIHIDLFTSTEYQQQIQGMIASQCHPTTTSPDSSLCHIHMIQSDIVIYRTDSISMVNYKILYYITIIIKYQYDYVVLCDGLSYPLVSPEEFRQILSTNRQVYLGQLLHNGRAVEQPKEQQSSLFIHRLYSKRLIYATQICMTNSDTTTTTIPIKLHLRLPRSLFQVPSTFQQQQIDPIYYKYNAHMKYKSTSGNQGIYSYNVVSRLVTSAKVQELFALSKYSCCCCMEEHNWIAALHLIDIESKREDRNGYGIDGVDTTSDNANNSHGIFYDAYIRPTSMFQLWGGMSSKCQGTMSNAFLSTSGDATSLCYRSEDPYHSLYTTYRDRNNISGSIGFNNNSTAAVLLGYDETKSNYFLGDELWNVLMHSKHHRQAIMARKFTSITNDTESYRQLIQMIQAKLWMK